MAEILDTSFYQLKPQALHRIQLLSLCFHLDQHANDVIGQRQIVADKEVEIDHEAADERGGHIRGAGLENGMSRAVRHIPRHLRWRLRPDRK